MSDGVFRDRCAAVERAARLETENGTLRAELAAARRDLESNRQPDNAAAVQRRLVEERNDLFTEVLSLREKVERQRDRIRALERRLKSGEATPGSPADWVMRLWRGTLDR